MMPIPFAVTGNITFLLSIFVFEPDGKNTYLEYLAVNASWIIGSMGSLLLDCSVFLQFIIYGEPVTKAKS